MARNENQKQAEVWARRFTRELAACETLAEWGELIALNGAHLGHCSEYAPALYATVKAAIATEADRIDPPCRSASSSNAASPKKGEAENIPTTSTDPDRL